MFFKVRLHSRSFLLRADWWKSDSLVDEEPQGNWRWNSNSSDIVAIALLPFPALPPECPGELARRIVLQKGISHYRQYYFTIGWRAYGVPTIRSDLPAPTTRRVADTTVSED